MARKKKTELVPKIIFFADRIQIQMNFLNNEDLGCLIRMLTFHAMGMEKEVDMAYEDYKKVHGENKLIEMCYKDHCLYIDENNKAYADMCERNKRITEEREAKRREKALTDGNQPSTSGNESLTSGDQTLPNINTKTNTRTMTKSSVDDEEIKKEITSSSLLFDGEDIKKKVDEMLASPIWLEDVQRMFSKSEEDIKFAIREFALMCRANEKQLVDLTDAKRYFVNWYRLQLAEQAKNQARNQGPKQQNQGTKEVYDISAKLAEDERKSKEFAERANKKKGIPEDCKYVLGMINK